MINKQLNTELGCAPAPGSAPSYEQGYKDGRESLRRKLNWLQSEILRLKSKEPTIDECALFLIRRAEQSAEGARILLGMPKSDEVPNDKVTDGSAKTKEV